MKGEGIGIDYGNANANADGEELSDESNVSDRMWVMQTWRNETVNMQISMSRY